MDAHQSRGGGTASSSRSRTSPAKSKRSTRREPASGTTLSPALAASRSCSTTLPATPSNSSNPPGNDAGAAEGTGSADGKTVKLKGRHQDPIEGYMKHHAVWKIVDGNTQVSELYGSGKHMKDMKMMEITYTRKQ